ncbi:energy transducer TonB [Hymenobacter sp. BT188]|uniref:energy transducer TonB n=1 Tax=Hymenobacter sp. BT188 TaxID=2763504 RepID=UPI00165133BF|nr:energy transducer TonB [Hymenobacter sp. BT188]MBC6607280.1 energy transducer TonB [Hymenobacter sp. BT188]
MKTFLLLLLLVSLPAVVWAQQTTKAPVVLKPGQMQAQAKPAANRPDVPPQFPGGAQAMNDFFQKQVKYPAVARDKSITGNVVTTFTVEADGRVSKPAVITSLSPECDAEALRVLSQMPAWKPATRKGQPVAVQVRLPVPFGNSSIIEVEKPKGKMKYQ